MVKKSTSIHINGKQYDALTGNLLHDPIVPRKAPRNIDGIAGGPVKHKVTKPALKPLPAAQVPRAKAAHHARKPATSQTLMRHAVKKPTTTSVKRRSSRAVVHAAAAVPAAMPTLAKKHSVTAVNSARLQRASLVATHPRIARYGGEVSKLVHSVDQAFVLPKQEITPTIIFKADVSAPKQAPKASDIFEQALLKATSHQEAPVELPKKARAKAVRSLRRRMVSYGAGAMAVLAIVGFLSFASPENVKFRVATRDAGFSASMPGYVADGYGIGDIKTISGYVNVNYVDKSGAGRNYAVTQKASSWNSAQLSAIIRDSNGVFNTLQTKNGPIYVYGQNQAAWVDNGVLTQVLGNGALNTDDFTLIASSM